MQDYRISERRHRKVNMKNFIVLGEGCESPHSCIQNAVKKQQFCQNLDANICQQIREHERNNSRMVFCKVNLNPV